MPTFQELIRRLSDYWESKGCLLHQGYDLEVGAGTMNPATFLRALGPEPYNAAYVEPCRRPSDGRYGENPNRTQHYFQYQVIMKPSPTHFQDLYIESLKSIGIDLNAHDLRFVRDDWENPTIGAWGLGWEVWLDGMEVTQFTYFQGVGGLPLSPITGELTYGLERIAMCLQNVDSFFDLKWNDHLLYGDIYHRSEVEWSHYNFERATVSMWLKHFDDFEAEATALIANHLPLPAYEFVMKASHAFNLLDARGAISVTERTQYIRRIRELAKGIAKSYIASREAAGYPFVEKFPESLKESLADRPLPPKLLSSKEGEKGTFLLEIGVEELPAHYVEIGFRGLESAFQKLFSSHNLHFGEILTFGTPRRLAIQVTDLTLFLPPKSVNRRGPPLAACFDETGEVTQAGRGFFQAIDLPPPQKEAVQSGKIENLYVEEQKGKEYLFAKIETPSLLTGQMLASSLPDLISKLEFPKQMRWSDEPASFARPIRWIVALIDEEILPFEYAGVHTSNISYGHRQLSPKPFSLQQAADYVISLKEHKVIPCRKERREHIKKQLRTIEGETKGQILEEETVLNEVVDLVEWPHVTCTSFDRDFLKAPHEVLICEMIEHQKYFPLADRQGELLDRFVITSNNTPNETIRKNNQKVLSARLSDGVFLYEKGLKTSLDEYGKKLQQVTFLQGMGNLADKVLRLIGHGEVLQKILKISTDRKVRRACRLSKSDLVTEMVGEFPDLQGTIGKYYAQNQKEDPEVALAIEEQWMPKGEDAPLPQSETGAILSLADKIDTLISCFSAGLIPTSSKDPYALRRQAFGVLKILIRGQHHLNLPDLFNRCCGNFIPSRIRHKPTLLENLLLFLTKRAKSMFEEEGFAKEEVAATLTGGLEDPYASYQKLIALQQFRKDDAQFSKLYEVYKRVKGQIEGKKQGTLKRNLCAEPTELALLQALETSSLPFKNALAQHEYNKAYQHLADLQRPLAALFDNVKILADDKEIMQNRIALLQLVFERFSALLDFSKIHEHAP